MKSFRILSATLIPLIFAATAFAEEPATPPATPANPPTPATPPATPATPGTDKKTKLSPGDAGALKQVIEALLYQRTLAETGKGKAKENAEVGKFGEAANTEILAAWTPLVSFAQNKGAPVPTAISKGDKAEFDKLGKVKADKYAVEYFQLASKQSKHNARVIETALKSVTDPELKTMLTSISKFVTDEAEKSEAAYKEIKSPKKPEAKK